MDQRIKIALSPADMVRMEAVFSVIVAAHDVIATAKTVDVPAPLKAAIEELEEYDAILEALVTGEKPKR